MAGGSLADDSRLEPQPHRKLGAGEPESLESLKTKLVVEQRIDGCERPADQFRDRGLLLEPARHHPGTHDAGPGIGLGILVIRRGLHVEPRSG